MHQDYDPCEHGLDSSCCACEITQLTRQAEKDDDTIILLQDLLVEVVRAQGRPVPRALQYLDDHGLL